MSNFDLNGWVEAPHDPRSLEYPVFSLAASPVDWPVGAALHPTKVDIDQGRHGICVGASSATWLGTAPKPKVTDINVALSIYRKAKTLDPWPNDDDSMTGTTMLAGMQAAKELGLIGEYRWLFGAKEVCAALLKAPVLLGIPWFEGMQSPVGGVIRMTGQRTGGHAIAAVGYSSKTQMVTLRNTWGLDWGLKGKCRIHRDDLAVLLTGHGEAVQPSKL